LRTAQLAQSYKNKKFFGEISARGRNSFAGREVLLRFENILSWKAGGSPSVSSFRRPRPAASREGDPGRKKRQSGAGDGRGRPGLSDRPLETVQPNKKGHGKGRSGDHRQKGKSEGQRVSRRKIAHVENKEEVTDKDGHVDFGKGVGFFPQFMPFQLAGNVQHHLKERIDEKQKENEGE